MDELARLLSFERRLLELLLFKLVEGRHLLVAGEARFLPYAAAEIERATERVHEVELRRSMLVSDPRLSALARDTVEPYRTIFSDHRLAFLELAAEIEDVSLQNRRLAVRGADDVEALLAMVGAVGDVDIAETVIGLQMDESAYQAVLGAVSSLSMPSLRDFLR